MNNIANSVLRYGGIDIPFLKTEKFVQEPVWSADGTDLLYTHIVIGVSGILNKCFLANGEDPATWIEYNRPALLQRGKQLYFYIGGTQVFPPVEKGSGAGMPATGTELVASPKYINPGPAGILVDGANTNSTCFQDAKLGPKPIRLDVRSIKGQSFSIYYEIETWLPFCEYSGLPQGVLSCRWESILDIDHEYYYQRTTNGILVLNAQWVNNQVNGFQIVSNAANIIFPPLLPKWKRETVRLVMSPDNLNLSFQIVDKEQYVAIPRPAVNIEANYAEISPPEGMGKATSGTAIALMNFQQLNMDVHIWGDPNAQFPNSYPTMGATTLNPDKLKWALMKIMFQIVFSRIQFPFTTVGETWQQNQFITHFELGENVMKPEVWCRISALQTRRLESGPAGSPAVWQGDDGVFTLTNVAQPLLLDDMIAQVNTMPCSLGNYATFLFVQSICPKSPCDNIYGAVVAGQYTAPPTTVYSAKFNTISGTQSPSGTSYPTSMSQANYNHPFTDFTATVDYNTHNNVIQLPIMNDSQVGGSGVMEATPFGAVAPSRDAVFCTTANPTTRKIVHWKASRMGAWPKAPRPDSLDFHGDSAPKDKVLKYQVGFGEVEISNDGVTRHYSISGVYEIGMARRLQWATLTAIPVICNPTIGSSTYGDNDSVYPGSGFIAGLLCTGASPGNLTT